MNFDTTLAPRLDQSGVMLQVYQSLVLSSHVVQGEIGFLFQAVQQPGAYVCQPWGLKTAYQHQRLELVIRQRLQLEAFAFSINKSNVRQKVIGVVHNQLETPVTDTE